MSMTKSVDTPKTVKEIEAEFKLRTDKFLAEMREKEARWRARLEELSSRKR